MSTSVGLSVWLSVFCLSLCLSFCLSACVPFIPWSQRLITLELFWTASSRVPCYEDVTLLMRYRSLGWVTSRVEWFPFYRLRYELVRLKLYMAQMLKKLGQCKQIVGTNATWSQLFCLLTLPAAAPDVFWWGCWKGAWLLMEVLGSVPEFGFLSFKTLFLLYQFHTSKLAIMVQNEMSELNDIINWTTTK